MIHKTWWNNLSPITREFYQMRYYPSTNVNFLSDDKILVIYQNEHINEKNLKQTLYANNNNK